MTYKPRFKLWLYYFLSTLEKMIYPQTDPQFVKLKNGNINDNIYIIEFLGNCVSVCKSVRHS